MFSGTIDKSIQIPLHSQIYQDILAKIKSKELKAEEVLPSETSLQEIYGVSRITVRRAMQDLETDGYVKKYPGKGTIILKPKNEYNLQELTSVSSDIEKYGGHSSSIIKEFKEVTPKRKVAIALGLHEDEPVFYLERLRLNGDEVVALNKAYIKNINNINLRRDDFDETTSLYGLLNERGIKLDHAVEILEAQVATDEIKDKLLLADNVPIFYKERTTYDIYGEPVEFVEIYNRGDVYQYRVRLDLNGENI